MNWETAPHSGVCRACGDPSDWAESCSSGCECSCTFYVVDHSDPERYHTENVDREDSPTCPEHGSWTR